MNEQPALVSSINPVVAVLHGRAEARSVKQVHAVFASRHSLTVTMQLLSAAVRAGMVERRKVRLPSDIGRSLVWGYYLTLRGAGAKGRLVRQLSEEPTKCKM